MKTSVQVNDFGTRSEHQVKGISQNYLGTRPGHLLWTDRPNRTYRPNRHEGRGIDHPSGVLYLPPTRAAISME